jgi:pimeloyl-ACP methyl ester carboxylesterase
MLFMPAARTGLAAANYEAGHDVTVSRRRHLAVRSMTTLIVVVAVFCAGCVATLIGSRLIDRAHRPRGRFIEIDGFRQHVVDMASGNTPQGAPPVVLLHGAGSNLEDMYLALGERLAAHHRVILVDRPGLGFSEREAGTGSSPGFQAAVLGRVLDRLGIDRVIIVGHSWGGTLALALALDQPRRIAGLVLIAPPTHPGMWAMKGLNSFLAGPAGRFFAYTLALPFGALLMRPGSRAAFRPQPFPQRYVKRSAAMLVLRPVTLMANWADVGELNDFLVGQSARYGDLAVPTIVLAGDSDPLVLPANHCVRLAAAASCVKVDVLPGYGHMLHHGAADRVAEAVEEIAAQANAA